MKERILARILCLCLLCLALTEGKVYGQEVIKVGILPFQVYARDPEKAKDWSTRVASTLASEMKKDEQVVLVGEDRIRKALEEIGRVEID